MADLQDPTASCFSFEGSPESSNEKHEAAGWGVD